MQYDVIIAGGGPAGLAAALALGRARRRVLLCDAGPRRNAAAKLIYNFVTRDGTPPDEFRRLGREQLVAYPNVETRDALVGSLAGERGNFRADLGAYSVEARRVLLCTGMVDEMLEIDGFRELWGRAIFQCPYCHGWEAKDRRWGCLARPENLAHLPTFATMLRAWTSEVTVFTNDAIELSETARNQLQLAGVRVEDGSIKRLLGEGDRLEAVELVSGTRVACEALFAHPPQRQVELVRALGLALDQDGFLRLDPMRRESSVPGVYAAGDLTTRAQGAMLAAADGVRAAGAINVDLMMDLAAQGALRAG